MEKEFRKTEKLAGCISTKQNIGSGEVSVDKSMKAKNENTYYLHLHNTIPRNRNKRSND